ncbi:WG repeat-containing protein [Bizionia argentinensis JUB59]|uniref:WG repeat-containing protein n=1 Tax=Bizionia argentinensis JUB59 TaxID=1046627 RepID=G2ECS4_9FLAO|nr:WG repeat-containing protein [Bizionia argentinensis]EGV43712.1 WG repeat-containing protein [Bizionia argentinensis JUB59]
MVLEKETGKIIGIDEHAKELFEVFKYDNGPDYIENGPFRILKNGRIGYANAEGKIIIEPTFQCAYPFSAGKAKVADTCESLEEDGLTSWESESWYYVSTTGKRVEN